MSQATLAPADLFKQRPIQEREALLAALSEAEQEALFYDWDFWARPQQQLPGAVNPRTPDGAWDIWLPMAGRGWGKTRTGAEAVRAWVRTFPLVNLVAPTAADARDTMVEGPSGILRICPRDERPRYRRSKRLLEWPNGARSLLFSADEPDRLRGPQHYKAWADEPAAWRYPEAWDQLMLGLRMGDHPQAVATTTPRPTAFIKSLVADPRTLVTRGSTYENEANLARTFLSTVLGKYEGTRLGRQEIHAEVLEDNPSALWRREHIDGPRLREAPATLARVVVGVDPAVTSTERSDQTGIVVAAADTQSPPHFYVLDDRTLKGTPDEWAAVVAAEFRDYSADRVVGEVNNGGDLVEAMIRTKSRDISYTSVTASRGKAKRAEPVAALYEQGRVHHIGCFPQLEDQMCDFDPTLEPGKQASPDRMDALVWALTELMDDGTSGLLDFYREEAQRLRARRNGS